MSESLVSKASRIIRAGNDLSGTNQKMKEAIHSFLSWFCPIVAEEQLPFKAWEISVYGNDAWGLTFGYDGKMHRLRSDGFDCQMKDYHAFCLALAALENDLVAWMNSLIQHRKQTVQILERVPAPED